MPASKENFLNRITKEYVIEPYKRMRDKSEKEMQAEQYLGTTQEEMDALSKQLRDQDKGVKDKAGAYAKGGKVSSASKRADGCCQRGKTRGKMV